MCGRTSLAVDLSVLRSTFDITVTTAVEEYVPQYNIDPSDGLVTITNDQPQTADVLEWGFIPQWADDPDDGPTPINARSESAHDSNLFRAAFNHRRCLILADGFYEWTGPQGSKQPYRIRRTDREPFAFAGLWSQWNPDHGDARHTTTILTTDANDAVAEVHDRMPVMLEPEEHDEWLHADAEDAKHVLDPFPADKLDVYPVSKQVSNPENDSPDLFEPIEIGDQSGLDDFGA